MLGGQKRRLIFTIYGAMAIFGVLLAGCANLPPNQQLSLPQSPARRALVPAIERENARIIESYGGAHDDPRLTSLVEKITTRLVAASERPDLKYQITILNSPAINAFALPDGRIYLTRGLIALANDEAELASVLAHEMGHVIAHHAAVREEQAKQVAIVNRVVTDVLSDPEAGALALAKSKLALASFSREQEFEADRLGIGIAALAGYDPFGASRFLADMQRNADLKSPGADFEKPMPDFLTNHPATRERVQNALASAGQLGGPGTAERHRGEYLSNVDGLVYGEDPRDGFVRGRRFVNAKLGFSFVAPPGFVLSQTRQGILGQKKEAAEALRFDVAGVSPEQALPDYLKSGWLENIDPASIAEFTVAGFPAATATADSEQWAFQLYVLRSGDEVFRFIFAAKNKMAAVDRSFRDSIMSIHHMSPAERQAIRPARLKIISVRPGDTPERLARRMAISDHPLEIFRILNGLAPNDRLSPGERVKIVIK